MFESSTVKVLDSSILNFHSNTAHQACGGGVEVLAGSAVTFFDNTAEGGEGGGAMVRAR